MDVDSKLQADVLCKVIHDTDLQRWTYNDYKPKMYLLNNGNMILLSKFVTHFLSISVTFIKK